MNYWQMQQLLREVKKMRAEIVEVIRTETTEGKGTKEDPVRTVVRYWDRDGILLFETEK